MAQTAVLEFPRKSRVAIIALLAIFGLGACAPNVPLTEAEIERAHRFGPPYQVERTVHTHLVPVSATGSQIDEQQYRDLYDFLIGVGVKTGDVVVLASRRSRLEQRAQVQEFLRRVGVQPETKLIKEADTSGEDDGYDQAVLVQYDRYTPRQHECGKWGEKVKTTYYNTSPRNFGCTTANAMQQQVAFPSSLIEGQPLAFPEGDYASGAVGRYRGRKVEAIKAESVGG
ncbi:MAG: CpaD family pilus assembly protein [Gammaproteobacteria bacterium]|nr:CpaD family pilus assembly protein [Gammaproteobacteria bacterium]